MRKSKQFLNGWMKEKKGIFAKATRTDFRGISLHTLELVGNTATPKKRGKGWKRS